MKISVKAKSGSKIEKVEKAGEKTYVVSVKAQPVDGKANVAIIRALARHFEIAPSVIRLVSGQSSKHKRFEIG